PFEVVPHPLHDALPIFRRPSAPLCTGEPRYSGATPRRTSSLLVGLLPMHPPRRDLPLRHQPLPRSATSLLPSLLWVDSVYRGGSDRKSTRLNSSDVDNS